MALQFPSIDAAIANVEGFNATGAPNWSQLNNNPGNLVPGAFATANGATGANGGFAVFPDADTGTQAEDNLVNYYAAHGASLSSLLAAWAPGSVAGNAPSSYTAQVAGSTGLDPNAPLSSYLNTGAQQASTFQSILNAIGGAALATAGPLGAAASVATGTNPAQNVPGDTGTWYTDLYRISTFIVGVLLFGAGIFFLGGGKPSTIIKVAGAGLGPEGETAAATVASLSKGSGNGGGKGSTPGREFGGVRKGYYKAQGRNHKIL